MTLLCHCLQFHTIVTNWGQQIRQYFNYLKLISALVLTNVEVGGGVEGSSHVKHGAINFGIG